MSVKILGGVARGFPVATPKSDLTRPTSVIIKRKLFDWRQHLDDFIFIDLCAGSGAVGLEALSRGAKRVFLNDVMKPSFLTLKENKLRIEKSFKFDPSMVKVTSLDAVSWINKELPYELPQTESVILFLDPPYEGHSLYFDVLNLLKEKNFKGEIWLESDRLKGPPRDKLTEAFSDLIKVVEQGDHFVVVGKVV